MISREGDTHGACGAMVGVTPDSLPLTLPGVGVAKRVLMGKGPKNGKSLYKEKNRIKQQRKCEGFVTRYRATRSKMVT